MFQGYVDIFRIFQDTLKIFKVMLTHLRYFKIPLKCFKVMLTPLKYFKIPLKCFKVTLTPVLKIQQNSGRRVSGNCKEEIGRKI